MGLSKTAAVGLVAVSSISMGSQEARAQPADVGRYGLPSPTFSHLVLYYLDAPLPGCPECAFPVPVMYKTRFATQAEVQYYWPNAQYDPWWMFRDHFYYSVVNGDGPTMSSWGFRIQTWDDHFELNSLASTQQPSEPEDCLTPSGDVTICMQSAFYKETFTYARFVATGYSYTINPSVEHYSTGFDEWEFLTL